MTTLRLASLAAATALTLALAACGDSEQASSGDQTDGAAADTSTETMSGTGDDTRTDGPSQQTAMTDNSPGDKMAGDSAGPFDVEGGKIVYEVTGVQTGTITRYWRKNGQEIAEYRDLKIAMAGIEQVDKAWVIIHPDMIYTIDMEAGSGTKAENAGDDMVGGRDPKQMGADFMKQMGGQKVGTDTIAGRECERWEIADLNTKVCLWKGLDLNVSGGIGGMTVNTVAVEIDAPAQVEAKHFTPPDNINYADQGNPLDALKGIPNAEELMKDMPNAEELMKQPDQGRGQP